MGLDQPERMALLAGVLERMRRVREARGRFVELAARGWRAEGDSFDLSVRQAAAEIAVDAAERALLDAAAGGDG